MNRQARAVYLDEMEHPHPRTRADRVVVGLMYLVVALLVVMWLAACAFAAFSLFQFVGGLVGGVR